MLPLDPSLIPDPLSLHVRRKRAPDDSCIHFYTACVKPVMMYTDDTRTMSLNIGHVIMALEHRNNWREMNGGKLGMHRRLQAYEGHPTK